MIVCSFILIGALVWLCLKSPLVCCIAELIGMLLVSFAGLTIGLYAALTLSRFLPAIAGLIISLPTISICWQRFFLVLKELRAGPALWS
jgi:hypothetical protein